MKVITFTEARNKLKAVLDRLIEDADYTVITRRDADDAVVMSLEYMKLTPPSKEGGGVYANLKSADQRSQRQAQLLGKRPELLLGRFS